MKKYPKVAARVREHLETGWEPTLTLLEQAMGGGRHPPGIPAGSAADDLPLPLRIFLQTARLMHRAYPTRMLWMR